MITRRQHLQAPAHDLPFGFNRLVTIGISAKSYRCRDMPFLRQFGMEQRRGIGFRKQPAFKVQPRRQVMIGMRRPRITINAAMLTAAIRIDRFIEGDVGRVVARKDRPGAFNRYRGAQRRHIAIQLVARVQPISIGLPRIEIEPRWNRIGRSSAPGGTIGIAGFGHAFGVSDYAEQIKHN
jgi:hypothetical protein